MRTSNYDRTRDEMRGQFLLYDQSEMIEKFSLRADEAFLYIRMLGRSYRIGRRDGVVTWSDDGFATCTQADYLQSLTIYDVLCCSKPGCRATGRYAAARSLPGVVYTGHTGRSAPGGSSQSAAAAFHAQPQRLAAACQSLGGTPEGRGDVAFRIPLFDFLPVLFQFWRSDEEFPASIALLWDTAALDFMRYESMCYAETLLLRRLLELMGCGDEA